MPTPEPLRHRWMLDWASPWEYTAHAVRHECYHARSQYQDIEIIETEGYGRCLLLDGEVQSFEADEHVYHESLVHPGLFLHSCPRRVLVIGGGEGATLREVLRHGSVEQAVMVELDPQMIVAADAHLPTFHAGAFDDPRVRLHFADGRQFVEGTAERFDAAIIDVTNPLSGGLSYRLFTAEFYAAVRDRLQPGGLVVVQSDAVGLHGLDSFATIHRTLAEVFSRVRATAVFLPAYTTDWSFTIAGDSLPEPHGQSPAEIDRAISQRLKSPVRYYDGITHHRLFHLPRYVREAIARSSRVNRDAAAMQVPRVGF
jgi:spermidine synthase